MAFGVLCTMCVILIIVLAVCHWSPSVAYNVLKQSQHVLESDEYLPNAARASKIGAVKTKAKTAPARRPYITPLVKKRVAAKQKWRCASCQSLLDETFELDHRLALFAGGTNSESNLQCLCKRCHVMKSALEQAKI